jgi:MFS family permease
MFFLLIGGVAVDRLPRVQLMFASDLLRGAVVTVVAILAFGGSLEIWHVLVASLIFGLVDAVFQPAYTALVPELLPREALPSANSLSSMSHQIGRIAGPALGAAIIGLGGTPTAFAFNTLSFFISAVCLMPLLGIVRPPLRESDEQASNILRDVREGFAVVLRSPVLWISILAAALINITLAGPYSVALPFLVKDHLYADASLLGVLYAIFPAGYLLGGI